MGPDPVLAAIDATLEAVQPVTCACGCGAVLGPRSKSMYYAGEACQHRWMRRGKPSTASGPGWVSPPGTTYATGGRVEAQQPYLVGEFGCDLSGRAVVESHFDPARREFLRAWVNSPIATSGPVPRPPEPDAGPARPTLSNDVPTHRVDHPLRIWWKALRRKVNR